MGVIDRTLKRLFGRSLDAAGGGRLWDGARMTPSVNSAIQAGGRRAALRANDAVLNNAYIAGAVKTVTAEVVGTGIFPKSRHPDEGARVLLDAEFAAFSPRADITGRLDWPGLQLLVCRGLFIHGEAFVRLRVDESGELRLQLINADQVDPSLHRDLDGGRRIRSGIEFDADGRAVAYHVLPHSPGDTLAPLRWDHVRVPAEDMLHVFETLEPGQVRGLSHLAAALLKAKGVDDTEEAILQTQKVAALLAGILVDPTGDAAGFDGRQIGSILDSGLEPGTLKVLPPPYDIKFSDPPAASEPSQYLKHQLRAVAVALGMTYEQLTGDLSGVNYSSIRAGLVAFRRKVDVLRWTVLVPQLCRPVWDRFVTLQALNGTLTPGAGRAWMAADWHAPAWEWVDPLKDMQAEKLAVEEGFKARSAVVAEMGEDPERVDALRAEDKARAKRLGLDAAPVAAPRSGGGGSPSAAAPVEPEEDNDA